MKMTSYPPSPKGFPIIGHLFQQQRDPLGFLLKAARDYGDIVYIKLGPRNFFLLSHPSYIEDVLVKNHRNFEKMQNPISRRVMGPGLVYSNGEFHHRQRRLVQPAFHRQRIATYATTMTEYAVRLRERWQHGITLDIVQEMSYLALMIAGKTLFNADVESDATEINRILAMFVKWGVKPMPFYVILEKLPLPSVRRRWEALRQLDAIIYRIIAEHRASDIDRGDVMSMLLRARDEEGDGTGMTDQQVRHEAMNLFITGHETTATSLAWTWYLLSQHPEVEAKFHHEIDTVLAGRPPTIEDIPRLPYTNMILTESMRLYPPIWRMCRQVINPYEVESYVLPPGSVLVMSQYVVHRDPRYFPDPLTFNPDRWTSELEATLPRGAYFPFGPGGPRQCIGESFSWTEGTLVMTTLAQKWRMRFVPEYPVEPFPTATLRSRYPMQMKLERRDFSPN
jgi:cytochrome P450